MRLILIACFIVIALSSTGQSEKQLFRGGMLPHAAYFKNQISTAHIEGIAYGIGGKLSFHIGRHLRLGTEGYVTTFKYNEANGFFKFGWGGLLAEYQFSQGKIRPVAGLCFGGGRANDLYTRGGTYTDNAADLGIYKTYSTLVLAPQLSLEYGLTDHVNLVCKADYLLYPGNDYPDYIAKGVRLYFGVLFSR